MKLVKMGLVVALTSAVSGATSSAQPNTAPTTIAEPPGQMARPILPGPTTPREQIEFDLKALFSALNSETIALPTDYFAVPTAISGARIGYFGLSEWKDYFLQQRGKTRYRIDKIEVEKLERDMARVKISYSLLTPNNIRRADGQADGPPIQVTNQSETLELKREAVSELDDQTLRWRVVPPDFQNLRPYPVLALENVAYFASQRAGTLGQLRAQIAQSRLKQCALGALQFTQDYDERFRFDNEFWREAIRPYVQNDAVFGIPGTQTPYTFNNQISDKTIAQVHEVARTVLFYEGEEEKPVFRYAGKAAICFVDGHVALVSPDEAKSLIWKP